MSAVSSFRLSLIKTAAWGAAKQSCPKARCFTVQDMTTGPSERIVMFFLPLKNHKDIVAEDIPPDTLMGVNALAKEIFRKEIKVTSPSNIDFATYRTGPVKAYDINGDNQADYIILEPTARLHKPIFVEVAGDSNEVSIFMIVSVKAKSLKRIYGAPGFYYSPRYYCVADLDSDGNLEILLEEGFGEAFHFEIYRFSEGFPNLYRGTEFGC